MTLTARQRRTRNNLAKILKMIQHEELVAAMWAVRALQSGRVAAGRRLIRDFPLEGATPDLKSKYAFYPWRIEILINELFSEGEGQIKDLERKRVNLSSFNGISLVSNKLYEAECADDAASIDGDMHILNQMHRIIHLQTEWQSGFLKYSNFYRAGFLYGGVLSRGTFKTRSGVDLELFTKAIFYLYAIYQNNSGIRLDNERGIVDIDPNDLNTIMKHISISKKDAAAKSKQLRNWKDHISYRKSFLRQWPVISFDSIYYCPLPELLILRIGSGLYYDLISQDGAVRNEISNNFELYIRNLLEAVFFRNLPQAHNYRVGRNRLDAPDIIIEQGEGVAIVLECKATRMSFEAMFAENPIDEAQRGYGEIIKGVFQVWRYCMHCRLGLTGRNLNIDARGIVLTLDPWLMTANLLQDEIIDRAKALFNDRCPEGLEEDCIPMVFCPVVELEVMCNKATRESLIATIDFASEQRYKGFHLSTVHKLEFPDVNENRPYAFSGRMSDVWPWWGAEENDQ